MKYIAIIILLFSLTQCRTAGELVDKALDKDSTAVAKKLNAIWPCIDGKVLPSDSVEYKDWQSKIDQVVSYYEMLLSNIEPEKIIEINASDSIKALICLENYENLQKRFNLLKERDKDLKPKVLRPPAIHDTLKVLDTRLIFLAEKERDQARDENVKLRDEKVALQEKVSKRNKVIAVESGILFILLILLLWKLYRKIKPI